MNCKNCNHPLNDDAFFCEHCGAKVIKNRITLRSLLSEAITSIFGWDNKYFFTVRTMFARPGILLREYIDGTRKKYMNPIGFLVIGLTIGIFLFNVFSEQYLAISDRANESQMQWMAENIGGIYESEAFQEKSRADSKKAQVFVLRYLNILTLINLPVYAFMCWLVFRKPYNFGEHLVINAYLQGVGFLFTTLFFLVAITIHPMLFFLNLLATFYLYCYAYKQLYQLSLAELILKILLFFGILIGLTLVLGLLFFLGGYLAAKWGLMDVGTMYPQIQSS